MLNVLFSCGNAPGLPTGYGGQCLLALRAFQRAGAKKVFIIAWNLAPQQFAPFHAFTTEEVVYRNPGMSKIFDAVGAHEVDWTSVFWFSNPYHQWPTTIRKQHINTMIIKSEANFFVSLQDIFMFEPGPMYCLSAVWMPLHFVPVEHPTILALADFDLQLPISGWGVALLEPLQRKKETQKHIDVIAHGRCPETYSPKHDSIKKSETRFKWGWPEDAFVVLLVASNSEESGRKAFDAQLQAFTHYKKRNPKAWLHIHAEAVRAYDIPRLLETFGETDSRHLWINDSDQRWRTHADAPCFGLRVSMTPALSLNSISEHDIADMYRAANVLLAATCSEGCGVPILEAQFCGLPVITTRATAMWEETLLGISVKPEQWIARMDFNSGWYLPHVPGIVQALEEIEQWKDVEERFSKIKDTLYKRYSNQAIIDDWVKIVNQVVKPSIETKFTSDELHVSEERKAMLAISSQLCKDLVNYNQINAELQEEYKQVVNTFKTIESISYIENLSYE
jgi:glycosyltransferase involved in cell wall biosynthesis